MYTQNIELVQRMYRNQVKYNNLIKKLFTKTTKNITLLGFFAAIFWPFIVSLNVLILAQILSTFFVGGKIIILPWVGAYTTFSLLMAVLFAASQAFFGIKYGQVLNSRSKRKKLKKLNGWLIPIFISIAIEVVLAYVRARELASLDVPVTQTPWDKLLLHLGPLFAAGLGFIVPLAEIAAAEEAFLNFFEPAMPVLISWFAGVNLIAWKALTWIVYKFYQNRFLGSKTGITRVRKKINSNTQDIACIKKEYKDIPNISFIENEHNNIKTTFNNLKHLHLKNKEYKTTCQQKKKEWFEEFESWLDDNNEQGIHKIKTIPEVMNFQQNVEDKSLEISNSLENWNNNIQELQNALNKLTNSKDKVSSQIPIYLKSLDEVIDKTSNKLSYFQENGSYFDGTLKELKKYSMNKEEMLSSFEDKVFRERSNEILKDNLAEIDELLNELEENKADLRYLNEKSLKYKKSFESKSWKIEVVESELLDIKQLIEEIQKLMSEIDEGIAERKRNVDHMLYRQWKKFEKKPWLKKMVLKLVGEYELMYSIQLSNEDVKS